MSNTNIDSIIETHRKNAFLQTNEKYSSLLDTIKTCTVDKTDTRHQITLLNSNKHLYIDSAQVFVDVYDAINACVRENLQIGISERQNLETNPSGIFIDIDLLTTNPNFSIDKNIFNAINSIIVEEVKNGFEMPFSSFYIVYLTKDNVIPATAKKLRFTDTEKYKNCQIYSSGLHIKIPSLLINKGLKIWFMAQVGKKISNCFKEYPDIINADMCFDYGSVYNVVFVYGTSRYGNTPYKINTAYKIELKNEYVVFNESLELLRSNALQHELSLLFERPGGIIKKFQCKEKSHIKNITSVYNTKTIHDVLKTFRMHSDPDAQFIEELNSTITGNIEAEKVRDLIDMLDGSRYESYDPWFKMLCLIARINPNYRVIAEYMSRKAQTSWNPAEFDVRWPQACALIKTINFDTSDRRAKDPAHISTQALHELAQMARQDSPDKFKTIRDLDLTDKLAYTLFNNGKNGRVSNNDIVELLYSCMKDQYAVDYAKSKKNGQMVPILFEFVTTNTKSYTQSQLYKWRFAPRMNNAWIDFVANSLTTHINFIMGNTKDRYKIDTGEITDVKQLKIREKNKEKLMRNLSQTRDLLGSNNFLEGVSKLAIVKFYNAGFIDRLDKDPRILGVNGGIVLLNKDGSHEFIASHHNYLVTKSTGTDYMEFDPHEPHIAKLLKMTRRTIPNHKSDTFEFLMCALSRSLDGFPKDGLWLNLSGPGANAKTTVTTQTYLALGGDYAIALPMSSIVGKTAGGGEATPDLIELKDRRFLVLNENDKNSFINMQIIKLLTGCDPVPARGLYEALVNLFLSCQVISCGNHDFIIDDTTYAAWRRYKHIRMEKCFRLPGDHIDPNNPYEERADPDFIKNISTDPKYASAWLAILLYYRKILCSKYKGSLLNVPHPNIVIDTEMMRRSQDKISQFIIEKCVTGPKSKQSVDDVINMYVDWYRVNWDSTAKESRIRAGVINQLHTSVVGKMITKDKRGKFVFDGCRFTNDGPSSSETYYCKNSELEIANEYPEYKSIDDKVSEIEAEEAEDTDNDNDDSDDEKKPNLETKSKGSRKSSVSIESFRSKKEDRKHVSQYMDNIAQAIEMRKKIIKETPEEYYQRLVEEYDREHKSIENTDIQYDSDNDILEEKKLETITRLEKSKEFKIKSEANKKAKEQALIKGRQKIDDINTYLHETIINNTIDPSEEESEGEESDTSDSKAIEGSEDLSDEEGYDESYTNVPVVSENYYKNINLDEF